MGHSEQFGLPRTGRGSLLLLGHDESQLKMRVWMLRDAGFEVYGFARLEGAIEALGAHRIDLMVLCHNVTEEECEVLVECAWEQGPLMDSGPTGSMAPRYVLLGSEGREGEEGWYERLYAMVVEVKDLMRVGTLVH